MIRESELGSVWMYDIFSFFVLLFLREREKLSADLMQYVYRNTEASFAYLRVMNSLREYKVIQLCLKISMHRELYA